MKITYICYGNPTVKQVKSTIGNNILNIIHYAPPLRGVVSFTSSRKKRMKTQQNTTNYIPV